MRNNRFCNDCEQALSGLHINVWNLPTNIQYIMKTRFRYCSSRNKAFLIIQPSPLTCHLRSNNNNLFNYPYICITNFSIKITILLAYHCGMFSPRWREEGLSILINSLNRASGPQGTQSPSFACISCTTQNTHCNPPGQEQRRKGAIRRICIGGHWASPTRG